MANRSGISGAAVAFATVGGVLIYAGFRGVNPLQAMRDIGGGKPPAVSSQSTVLDGFGSAVGDALGGVGKQLAGLSYVVSAAQRYTGDKYSQPRRQQAGYSDCSSFVDKALKDCGISPPFDAWASTANYRMSPDWKTIQVSESRPGDIAISSHHMVLVTAAGGTAAIGQQNPRVNVRTGSVANLMGSQLYVYKTYVGRAGKVVTA
jgi:hypothetical protein